jgi:DNA-binding HxlR family transcriptional regulator
VSSYFLPGVANRILQYLNKIEEGKGKANRMDFLRVAGNEEILNDWVDYLVQCNLVKEEKQSEDGKTYYVKTELGENLHSVLKAHDYLGPLLSDLSRGRRRSK